MRAVVFEEFGEPLDMLNVSDVPLPEPRSGEVRVRMLASPINPSDLMTVRGVYGKRPNLPATPGFEGVGIVEASGGGLLGRLLMGKRVAALNPTGGNWAEYAVIPARQAVPLPADVPWEQAAMFFVNPATAYAMTRLVLCVSRAQWLMQTAAGSALGRMVIRLGKHFEFRTLNVVRRAEQVEELRALGGDAVVHYDASVHSRSQLRDQVDRIAGRGAIRYALDPVGGETGSAVVECLGTGGRLLVYGTLCDEPLSFSPRTLMTSGASIEGFWLSRWMPQLSLLQKLRLMRNITRLMRAGLLVSPVGRAFPLDEIVEAVRASETEGRSGKVLLRLSDD